MHLETLMALWCKHLVGDSAELCIATDRLRRRPQHAVHLSGHTLWPSAADLLENLAQVPDEEKEMKKCRTEHELALIETLDPWLAPNTCVTLLADRGFGHQELYELLALLAWNYVIRFRRGVPWQGKCRKAGDWVAKSGRVQMLREARVTTDATPVLAVVTANAARMKDP